ncbi:hypothetical protein O6H91_18G069100 [Diphasiastrum complanatum]|uniref:Uncharacterized protein n=2 Tax=Diphasiastrum complanatum TaxID=34168 RepID=A0ACC2B2I2_DIPCM|nr:hypothetical protein O6H91_18G068600 [Diphasiastrum complanatum]KAJ7523933.1 hypothetical protein O6H91_18G069100 [Diphasiastrum complanatum]
MEGNRTPSNLKADDNKDRKSALGRFPSLPPEPSVNPFLKDAYQFTPLELLKTILMLPLFLIRILILVVVFLVGYASVACALIGVKDPLYKPFSTWRRALLWPTRFCARVALFALGYYWIEVKGRPASREQAPIIVSNHISFVDPVYVFYSHMPVIVSARENLSLPIVGVFLRALQIIPVDRTSSTSRHNAGSQVRQRAIDNRWPHIMLFPEGTTTNGKALISFKAGAFAPGLPVQPIVVQYPHARVSPAWVDIALPNLLFRLMTQFVNFMKVEYLEVVEPTIRELSHPSEYAHRVRKLMAQALNVVCTEHTFVDVKLSMDAKKYGQPAELSQVEFGIMEKLFHLNYETAHEYLARFSAMDITHSGVLHIDEFLQALGLPRTSYTEEVFHLFDKSDKGYINFREFVAGLAFISTHTAFADTVKAAFDACDADADGLLSKSEVEKSIRAFFPELPSFKVDSLFDALDMDHNGVISWQEFNDFLQRNPEYLLVTLSAYPDLLKLPNN